MAATVVGTATTATASSSTSISINVPTVTGGILSGDILLVQHVQLSGVLYDADQDDMDGELVALFQCGGTPSSNPGCQIFYEICAGGESGTRTISGTDTENRLAIAWVVRGGNLSPILDFTSQSNSGASGTTLDPATGTSVTADVLFHVSAIEDGVFETASFTVGPSGYTSIQAQNNNSNPGGQHEVWYNSVAAIGAETPSDITSDNDDEWGVMTWGIRSLEPQSETEGFRWRNDDGYEDDATWKELQDVNTSIGMLNPIRLRIITDFSGDYAAHQRTWKFKLSSDPDSELEDLA